MCIQEISHRELFLEITIIIIIIIFFNFLI